jgi:multiple sugar transport system substrate-binding protein
MKRPVMLISIVMPLMFCGVFAAVLWAGGAGEQKPLRMAWWGSQVRHDRTLTVLDMYTKATGVELEPEFYNANDYWIKMNAYIAAKEAPDIMQFGGNFVSYMDFIEILNDYISKKIIDTSNTDPAFIAITTLEGKTVGISNGTNAQAIAYDPEMFRKAGVPLPTNKWTWDEFEKDAMTIHEKLGVLGSSQLEEWACLSTWVTQYGAGQSFFREPYRKALGYTNDYYVTQFFALKKGLTDAKAYPDPSQMAAIKDIEDDPIVRGEAAMTWLSSNQFVAVSAAAKRPLALVVPPRRTAAGPLAQTIMSSQMMSITRESRQKEAAAKFKNFWVNDVPANMILSGERGVPIMKPVRDALSATLDSNNKAVYDYLTSLGKEAALNIVRDSPAANGVRDVYKRLSEQVVFVQITPEQAAAELRKEATVILSRVNERKPAPGFLLSLSSVFPWSDPCILSEHLAEIGGVISELHPPGHLVDPGAIRRFDDPLCLFHPHRG